MNLNKTVQQRGEEVSGAIKQLTDLGRTAAEKLEEARYGAADALGDAASTVRNGGRQSAEAIEDLAKNAAYKLDSTAAYVRNHDVGDALGSLRQVVRRHPASFLVGAAAVGFFLGNAIRRR